MGVPIDKVVLVGGAVLLASIVWIVFNRKDESKKNELLTSSEIHRIKRAWAVVQTLPAEAVGVLLFKHIFEIAGDQAPHLAKLFKFGREPDFDLKNLDKSKTLPTHGKSVVDTVSTAISMLTNLDELVPILVDLGKRHTKYGTTKEHYPVVGAALLATLEQGLPKEHWDPETKAAFGKMWGVVATTMQSEAY
jgi:hemoglobin-like flavoprotein